MSPSFPRFPRRRPRLARRSARPGFPEPRGLRVPYPRTRRRGAVVSGLVCAAALVALAGTDEGDGTGGPGGAAGTREAFLGTLERERLPAEHVLRSGLAPAGTVTRIVLDGTRPGGEELVLRCRGGGALRITRPGPRAPSGLRCGAARAR
ncbi:hypothetical protein [Streptomyces sp. SPB074]|uniref:hypothetical protein n=1 Tax=Streptomyces sp. (strain SPB074) TaxID=465543 RepID=UPI00017FEDFC|nr:hypothetical protein [Streptomyces sp. SPB074]EDY46523.1 hypothetical protein SSBG_04537 [Streptomyces sp. SPB074]